MTAKRASTTRIDWCTGRLKGKTFAFAKTVNLPELYEGQARGEGARVVKKMGPDVDCLVVGTGKSREQEAAKKLIKEGKPIRILTIKEFLDLFRPSPEEAAAMLAAGAKGVERWNELVKIWHVLYVKATPVDLRGVDLRKDKICRGEFLDGIILDGADFRDADLSNSSLAPVSGAKFDGCRLVKSYLRGATNCSFVNADLSNAQINAGGFGGGSGSSPTSIAGSKFSKAKMVKAELIIQSADGADFANADLQDAVLAGNLFGVDFTGAHLAGADLSSCKLSNATLARAILKNANLEGADLRGANLDGADLTGARLESAKYDEHTRFPQAFSPPRNMKRAGGKKPTAPAKTVAADPLASFCEGLRANTDPDRFKKALAMLKADRFRLYAQVADDFLAGVVKSQTDADLVYSCRLNGDGSYACCTQNLNICGGLRGSLCKHLLVLIVGLSQAGQADPARLDGWIKASRSRKSVLDKDRMSETLLRYKGAEAGEIDWRPTETIPEDYYAL